MTTAQDAVHLYDDREAATRLRNNQEESER